MAVWTHVAESVTLSYPGSKLLERYEWMQEAQWGQTAEMITAMEVGTLRALARSFGSGKLPDLPSYDDVFEEHQEQQERLPAWMREFERVNVGQAGG